MTGPADETQRPVPPEHAAYLRTLAGTESGHPSWCSAIRCTVHEETGGYHRSEPAVVEAAMPGQLSFLAQVWTPGYDDGDGPTLVLTVSDDHSLLPYVHTYDLEGWQLGALLDALAPLRAILDGGAR